MADTQFDVVLTSAFGRGHWLAAELADRGIKVALVETTATLGRWTPEDGEGPFGLFRTNQMSPSQLERVTGDDYTESVDQGFCVWLSGGPLDLSSPLTSYLLEKKGLDPACEEYLTRGELDSRGKVARQKLSQMPFERTWLAHLAHQWASNSFFVNDLSLLRGRALPLFSEYLIRRVSRRGFEKSLEWCEGKGVRVYRDAKVMDLSAEGSLIRSIEVKCAWSGVLYSDQFIWHLTGEQSERQGGGLAPALYPHGTPKPSWVWIRYGLDVGVTIDWLPKKFLLIEDLFLPWTHSNMCSVQRSVSGGQVDVWVRVPYIQRFHRSYLDSVGADIAQILSKRIPGSKPVVNSMPQNYLYDELELGPSVFPVFDPDVLDRCRRNNFKNLYYDSPEVWGSLDWTGQLTFQEMTLNRLIERHQKNRKSKSLDPEDLRTGAEL